MKIKMIGVYGVEDMESYFKSMGDGCFEFTWSEDWASDLTEEEAEKILANKSWYRNMYGAKDLVVI